MKIVPYDEKYRQAFIELNTAWISEIFGVVEQEDFREFESIDLYIERGGQIFFALDDSGDVAACCMIAPRDDGDWEIMKFAARGMYTGTGAGTACLKECIAYAESLNIGRIIIVSNTRCVHALHLYRKFGFTEMPVDKEKFPFDRADIAFEKFL